MRLSSPRMELKQQAAILENTFHRNALKARQ